jgi:hypothetical protein
MLGDPNISSPANVDASVQWRTDPDGYKKKCKILVAKSLKEAPPHIKIPHPDTDPSERNRPAEDEDPFDLFDGDEDAEQEDDLCDNPEDEDPEQDPGSGDELHDSDVVGANNTIHTEDDKGGDKGGEREKGKGSAEEGEKGEESLKSKSEDTKNIGNGPSMTSAKDSSLTTTSAASIKEHQHERVDCDDGNGSDDADGDGDGEKGEVGVVEEKGKEEECGGKAHPTHQITSCTGIRRRPGRGIHIEGAAVKRRKLGDEDHLLL